MAAVSGGTLCGVVQGGREAQVGGLLVVRRSRAAKFNPGAEPLHVGHSGPHRLVRPVVSAGADHLGEFLEGWNERDVYQLVSLAIPPMHGQVAVEPVAVGVAVPSKGLGQVGGRWGPGDGCVRGLG